MNRVTKLLEAPRWVSVVAVSVLLQACGGSESAREACIEGEARPHLGVTDPVSGASFESGNAVRIAFSYNASGWNFNTLEVTADGETICSVSPPPDYKGSCLWSTGGKAPGDYPIALKAYDFGGGAICTLTYATGVRISVVAAPARITTPPQDATVREGETATFRAEASGTAPISFQWLRNALEIPGATGSSYTTPPTALPADQGALFSIRVRNAGNAAGVWTWGYNNRGKLGDGTTTTRMSPVQVPGLSLN